MKPRIRMDRGVWVCSLRYSMLWVLYPILGHGYTPAEAYADWKAQQ